MIWPLEPTVVREFAHGLDEILVAEEKGPFVETHLKETLYGVCRSAPDRGQARRARRAAAARHARPGRRHGGPGRGRAAARPGGDPVGGRPHRRAGRDRAGVRARCRWPPALPSSARAARTTAPPRRPRARSWVAGIGCHTMVLLNPEGKGEITGITQMGGEGAQWIGMAPFTDDRHLVQNIGDGTFHHSGSLAVRAAVASGREHHLQAALQRGRGHDRRPGRGGRDGRARADPLAGARGRPADRRDHRGPVALPGREAGADRRGARPVRADPGPAGAGARSRA